MEEIKVGEHVRTKKGTIDIFKEKDENGLFARCEKNTYWMPDIVKHSKNIIDLIEIGDYVNGREVKHIAMFEGFPDYPKLIFVDEKHLIPGDTCENDEIKTILTKEQFEQNLYKV